MSLWTRLLILYDNMFYGIYNIMEYDVDLEMTNE